jgi:hypothetical protein
VIRLAGTASRNGFVWATTLNVKLVAQIDAGGVLNGTWTHKICNQGSPCETVSWPAGPNTMDDGRWTLALGVEHLGGGEFGGVAQILFGDGTTCDFTISGVYDPRKDGANVALSPVTPRCAGGSLRLRPQATPPGFVSGGCSSTSCSASAGSRGSPPEAQRSSIHGLRSPARRTGAPGARLHVSEFATQLAAHPLVLPSSQALSGAVVDC